jgi:hypothetical protein
VSDRERFVEKKVRVAGQEMYLYRLGAWVLTVVLIAGAAYLGIELPALPPVPLNDDGGISAQGYSNFSGLKVAAPTVFTTATPGALIDCAGLGTCLEVRDGATPVWQVNNGGSVTRTGDDAITGDVTITGRGIVAGPTTVPTAQAALDVSNAGVGEVAEFNDGTTELMGVRNGGGVVVTGPTAVATAQPALVVDSTGVSNLLEVRDAATPVFTVNNGGTVVGNLLGYGSSGEKAVTSTESITGTATVSHGLTTVTWALCTLGEDPTSGAGDAAHVTVAVSGNVVTAKVWQDDFVTAATEAEVHVHCFVVGTP